MFQEIAAFITALNSLTPLAILALGMLIWFYQAKNNKVATGHSQTLNKIQGNDLHELPDMAENIRLMLTTLQRIETNNASNFATIIALINGKSH